jgi:hypothetical protein
MNEEFITEAMAHGTKRWVEHKEPEPPPQPTGKSRSNSYNQKPGAADVALKPDASKAILRLDEWLKRDLEPPTLVMGEWLSTTSRVMLYAPTGLGKSMFGIALGMRVAGGNGFLHWQGHGPYRVLYIDGEMSRPLLKERLADEAQRLGAIPPTFYALSHEDVENFAPLNTEEGQKTIDGLIEKIGGIDLLFLDNIMCLVSGDMKEEESWRQTVPWQHSLTRRRIGQFWFHHTGHDESKGYGTKTKEWQLDTVLKMEQVDRDDTDVSFAIHFQKKRLCIPRTRRDFRDVIIALVDDRWELSEVDGSADAVKANPSPAGKKFFDARLNCKANVVGNRALVTMDDWERECIRLGLIDKNAKSNAKRALMSKYRRELVAGNWIACNDNHAWKV